MGKQDKEYTWTLIAKHLSGEASSEELQELERLLRQNPDLHYSMQTLIDLWHSADTDRQAAEHAFHRHLDRMAELQIDYSAGEPLAAHAAGRWSRRRLRTMMIAAFSILIAGTGVLWLSTGRIRHPAGPAALSMQPAPGPAFNEVATANGSRTHMVLPDGT